MVYFTDSKAFFEQSKLLLQARPTTTKITTKYTLPKPTAKLAKSSARQKQKSTEENAPAPSSTAAPKAILTLRTYDPVSGTVLKYQTDKQAEVGRLIAGLGRCARTMAALPDQEEGEGTAMEVDGGAGPAGVGGVVGGSAAPARAETPVQGQGQGKTGTGGGAGGQTGGGGGGGGKKKKKNKK